MLGYAQLSIQVLNDEPGAWAFNQIMKLQNSMQMMNELKVEEFGEIYVMAKYLPSSMADDHSVPRIIENLQQTLSREKGIFKGKLYLNIKHIKSLYQKINKPKLKVKIERQQPLILKGD